MIYIKYFIIYSIIGFIFESLVYKISKKNDHSGVLYGPYTLVYGFGGMTITLINNYIHINNYFFNILLFYILSVIISTTIEYLIGHLIHYIYKIDKWNYTNHKYHFGKYICLDYALIWGIISILFIKIMNEFIINLINIINTKSTIIILVIIIIDILFTTIKKDQNKI